MKLRHSILRYIALPAFAIPFLFDTSAALAQSAASAVNRVAPTTDTQPDLETLTRGPLHEAFAESVSFDPQPGIVVPKSPPEPVNEIPPEVQPAGNNVQWIPGYWAWEDDRDDFIWVSGVWRDIPPDRQWIPGYWAEVDGGYQWIAGFWTMQGANEVDYLPYPPASLERGPTSPQPSVNHYWVTGCWQYRNQRYGWRPGYWVAYRNDWIWTPDHYVWTPRGAVFIRGYWDYPLSRRGVAFAPVYFYNQVNYQRRYQYSPSVVINVNNLLFNLFVQPNHHHYYWGDYYGDRYRRSGYQPNFAYHGRSGYDPLFTYQSILQRRQGIDFDSRVREWHADRERDESRRPPRTFDEQLERIDRDGRNAPALGEVLTKSLRDVIGDGNSGLRFHQVREEQQQSMVRRATQLREVAKQRGSAEVNADVAGDAQIDATRGNGRRLGSVRLELPDADINVDAERNARTRNPNAEPAEDRPEAGASDPSNSGRTRPPIRDEREELRDANTPIPDRDNSNPPAKGPTGDRGPRTQPTREDTPNQPTVPPQQTTPVQPAPTQPAPTQPAPTQPAPAADPLGNSSQERTSPRIDRSTEQPRTRTPRSGLEELLNRRPSAPSVLPRNNDRPLERTPTETSPTRPETSRSNTSPRSQFSPPQRQQSDSAREAIERFRQSVAPTPPPRSVEQSPNRTPRFQQPSTQPRIETRVPARSGAANERGANRPQQFRSRSRERNEEKP